MKSSSDRFPTIAIFITALTWTGFACYLGSKPAALLSSFGVEQSTTAMLTEIRAFYGGVELAIAVCMILLWRLGDLRASLLVGALPLLGSVSGRVVGLVLDEFSLLHLGLGSFEAFGFVICLLAYVRVPVRSAAVQD